MSGLKKRSSAVNKYRVTLEGDERAQLERLVAVGKGAARRLTHARILLLADTALRPRPQPARPAKVKVQGAVEQRLIQLACSDPPAGRCHWTLRLLADEMVVLGLAESLSTEAVRQALKKTTSNRGSSRRGASRPRPTPTTSGGWRT